ncbi:MAG: SRPBCC family protein [Planctomycetota bacterium]
MILIPISVSLLVALLAVVLLTPRVVEYVEVTDISGSADKVYDAIRFQRDLMKWSAWPPETGSDCRVEGEDGTVGAQTVFLNKKGGRFGFQEVAALDAGRSVAFRLESKGPPHQPTLAFHLVPVTPDTTRVVLVFRNDITPPFHVALRLFGIVRWTRDMHRKDLDGLTRFVERGEDYRGTPLPAAA